MCAAYNHHPSPVDMEDIFDCEFRDPSGMRTIGTVRLRIGLEGATIENQNGILGKFAFTRILSWSTTDDKCFTFTVKTEQKTKQDITMWGPPQLIQGISNSVDAKVARLMVLKKEGMDINQIRRPPNPAAQSPMMPPMQMMPPKAQGNRGLRKLSKLFMPKSKQAMPPGANGFFPPGMPGMPPGMPPGSPGPQGFQQYGGGFTPQPGQQQQMQYTPQQGNMAAPHPSLRPSAPVKQPTPPPAQPAPQQQPEPAPQPSPPTPPAPAPTVDPVPQHSMPPQTQTRAPPARQDASDPGPSTSRPPLRTDPVPPPAYGGYGEYDFSPDGDKSELRKTLSHTREYAHKMKEALMKRDEQVIEATKKAEDAATREEATSTKVKELEDQLKKQLSKYEELRLDVESIKMGKVKAPMANGGALVPSIKQIGFHGAGGDEEASKSGQGADALYQTYKEEAEALRKANSMLWEQNHHLRSEQGGGGGGGAESTAGAKIYGGRRIAHHKKGGHLHEDARSLRTKVGDLQAENARLLQKISDQERLLQDYEATVAQTMTSDEGSGGNGSSFFGGGAYDLPYSRPSDPMQQLKSLMGEAYLVKMALKKQSTPSNLYVIESLDNWIMASHKSKKVCTF